MPLAVCVFAAAGILAAADTSESTAQKDVVSDDVKKQVERRTCLLGSDDPDTRETAISELPTLGKEASTHLAGMLSGTGDQNVLQALRHAGQPVELALIRGLDHQYRDTRKLSAQRRARHPKSHPFARRR